ncbi:hypothetical protein, conserved [Eimeria brunetti]|uniref:Cilia- and flagella-associated protein 299 n=1 Tax=Eimeria brunetti TaxID=51314 RepID=U6LHV4_9EIME|nr:hypothetical protein, conserved [Eimeria brunetti]
MGGPESLAEELRHVETYEDYLDSFLTENDRMYISDERLARDLVEIGCLKGSVLSREAFYQKAEALDRQQQQQLQQQLQQQQEQQEQQQEQQHQQDQQQQQQQQPRAAVSAGSKRRAAAKWSSFLHSFYSR